MKTLNPKTQFNEAKAYVKESKNYIYSAILIFIVAGIFGFAYRNRLGFIEEIIKELFLKTEGLNTMELIMFILQNNVLSAFLSIAQGIFLGVFPIFSAISNGVVIGYVLGVVKDATGATQFWRLIPHGIFELPAIFIALGLGIKFGSKHLTNYMRHFWKNSKIMIFIPIIIALISTALNYKTLQKTLAEINIQLGKEALIAVSLIQSVVLSYVIFFILTALFNKELKKLQAKTLKYSLYQSANAFLLIIIPLLIIAAIIEGLLIYLTA